MAALSVALIVFGLVIVQFSELTRDSAITVPGCPLSGDGLVRTERLVIRPVHPRDAAAYAATIDDEFRRENGWTLTSEQQWNSIIRSHRDLAKAMGYFVMERFDGQIVGGLSAQPFARTGTWHLGWWIRGDHRRQGYAREALAALTAELRTQGVRPLVFGMRTTNVANHRIAASLGATPIGTAPFPLPNGEQPQSDWFRLD